MFDFDRKFCVHTHTHIIKEAVKGMDTTDPCMSQVRWAQCSESHYNSHCADGKTEAQRDEIIAIRSHTG